MNPLTLDELMRAAWLLLLPAAGILCLLASRRLKTVEERKQGKLPNPTIVTVPGYRRALQSEVTSEMKAEAWDALSSDAPLGSVIIRDGYAIGVENHFDEERGWHRGASVFVKG